MNDCQIRAAFHNTILNKEHLCDNTFVVNELGLKHGQSRADIAVLNGKLVGYEIKSEKDTLNRLPSQVISYSQIFDNAFIIVAEKHLKNCMPIIPEWWGVYVIKKNSRELLSFKRIRDSKDNQNQDSFSIAQLLWKEEALEVAATLPNLNLKSKASRAEIYHKLVNHYSSKELSKIVLSYLKKRIQWR